MAQTETRPIGAGWTLTIGVFALWRAATILFGFGLPQPAWWRSAFGVAWVALGGLLLLAAVAMTVVGAVEYVRGTAPFRSVGTGTGLLWLAAAGLIALGVGRFLQGGWQRVLYGSGWIAAAGVAFLMWAEERRTERQYGNDLDKRLATAAGGRAESTRGDSVTLKGKAHKFGDNVDTDAIIPARYLNTTDNRELAAHVMEDADPEFVNKVKPGDMIVAGANFGCGSSREHAPIAIKTAGVSCVIAESFARIFFRNAINIGLPVLAAPEAARAAKTGDEIEVDVASGRIKNLSQGKTYQAEPFPEFVRELIAVGGLIAYTRQRLGGGGGSC